MNRVETTQIASQLRTDAFLREAKKEGNRRVQVMRNKQDKDERRSTEVKGKVSAQSNFLSSLI